MAKRKRAAEESSSTFDGNVDLQQLMEDAAAALGRATRARKKYIGVRQRPSGRWVAEIKDTIHNIRVWLGTYDTAEDAARAYDEAACMLRGTNTRTNFSRRDYPNPKPALPSKISNLLLLRLKARIEASNSAAAAAAAAAAASFSTNLHHEQVMVEESSFDTSSYLNLHADVVIHEYCNDAASSNSPGAVNVNGSSTHEFIISSTDHDHRGVLDCNWSGTVDDSNHQEGRRKLGEKVELEECDMGIIDFEFLDSIVSNFQFSPFEIVQEMVAVEEDNSGEKASTVEETVKRMKYERKFSASLYAFNGVSECLRLKHGSVDISNGSLENYELGQVMMSTSNGLDSHVNNAEGVKNEEDDYFEQMLQEQIQCMSNLVESSSSMSSS